MLTAKSIGGGGAVEVTNGMLQEMYAAEGEIPANTFVDFKRTLLSDSNEYLITKTETIGNNYPGFYPRLGTNMLIEYSKNTTKTPYSVSIAPFVSENGFYVKKNTLTVYSTGIVSEIRYGIPNFIKLDPSHIAMIWVKAVSGDSTISLKAKILNVADSGELSFAGSISDSITIATLPKDSSMYNTLSYTNLYLEELSDGSFVAIFPISKSSGSAIFAFKFKLDSELNFIAEKQQVLKTDTDATLVVACVQLVDDNLVFTTNGKGGIIHANILKGDDFTYKTFELGGVLGTHYSCSNDRTILILKNTALNATEIEAHLYDFNIKQFETTYPVLRKTWTVFTDPYSSSELRGFVEMEKNLFLVSRVIPVSYSNTRTQFGLLSLKEGEEGLSKEFIDTAPPILRDTDNPFVRTTDDGLLEGVQVAYQSTGEIYHFTLGKIDNLLLPATTQIKGITKSAATKEQKGQVWLLGTQEGEE